MRKAGLFLTLLMCLGVWAQSKLTIEQLVSLVKSSIELKHPDKKVAEYLRNVKLANKLDDQIVVELQTLGAGPKTIEALRDLEEASKNLPPAGPRVAEPPPPVIPPPSSLEQEKVLNKVRGYALNYVKTLPDFICTQVTRRYIDPSGLEFWQRQDVLTARLTYFEQKENYKLVLVNGTMTEQPYESVGGAISTGEFGSLMREIFEDATEAKFQWERWATLRGKRAHVFSYRVTQPHSQWRIDYEHTDHIYPAYHGLIYVDRDTLAVMRITLEADDIPASFPIQRASTILDYDYTKISNQEHMLPLKAVIRMRQGKFLVKNEVEFRLYRKFSAEAIITFDTPEPLPEEKTTEQPPKP
jgi:hypothetical protein